LSKRQVRTLHLAAAIGVVALAAAACSSSSSSTAQSSSTSSSSSNASSSSPIVVGSMAPLTSQVVTLPELQAGVVAAIDGLNAQGGIDGHQVKLDFCDTQFTNSGEISCMDQMISDKVSALIAPGIVAGTSGAPYELAEQADLANIGTLGLIPPEFNSPVVFPLSSGDPGWIAGGIASLVKGGARRIAYLGNDTGTYETVRADALAALKDAGLTPVNVVEGDPASDPTYSAAAAKVVAGNIDGLFLAVSPNVVDVAVRAVRAAGYTGPIAAEAAVFSPPIIKALGSLANGIEVSGAVVYPSETSNPEVGAYLADMKKYQPQAAVDQISESAWAAMQLYAKVMKGQTNFSSSNVLSLLKNLSTPIDLGMTGPYVVKGAVSPVAGFPNIYNPDVTLGVIRNGVMEQNSGPTFVDPFEFLKAASQN
jgi:branched-chain amino acid transport system substrate-binding protein